MTRIARGLGVVWRRADEFLVLGTAESEPLVIRGSAPAMWDLLAEPSTIEELAARLATAYAVDPSTVSADLDPLIRELVERGLLCELP